MRAMRTLFPTVPLLLLLGTTVAQAQDGGPVQVYAILNGGDIAPAPVLTGAFAFAELTIDTAKGELTVPLDAFNLPTGITGAHVHVGSPGVVGPVLFDLSPNQRMTGDVEVTGTISSGNLTTSGELGIRDISDAFQALIGYAAYIDIHTEGHGDGEVPGLIVFSGSDTTVAEARRQLLQTRVRR